MLALSLLSISVHGTSCKERGLPGGASHMALSYDLAHIGWQGRKQDVVGPLQDDEALLMFALSRALGVNRVLEIGSLNGASARNFLSAVSVSVLGPRNWVPARSTSDATRTRHPPRVSHEPLCIRRCAVRFVPRCSQSTLHPPCLCWRRTTSSCVRMRPV